MSSSLGSIITFHYSSNGSSLAQIGQGQPKFCIDIPDATSSAVQKTNGYVLAFFFILGVGLLVLGASTIGKLGELKHMNKGARIILATITIVAGSVVLFVTWIKRNKSTVQNEAEKNYQKLLTDFQVQDFRDSPHLEHTTYITDRRGMKERRHHVRWENKIIIAVTPDELKKLQQALPDQM